MRLDRVGVLAFLVVGLFSGNVEAGHQEGTDMKLEDMGFINIMRPASTSQQIERLRLLPPRKFVARTRDGGRYYLYADPDYCKCVFVGDEVAMNNYRNLSAPLSQPPMSIGPDSGSVGGLVFVCGSSITQRQKSDRILLAPSLVW
jgi:hypothetical protein